MTASVHALARPADGGRPPLVPAKAVLKEDAIYLRFDPGLLDTRWYRSCTPEQALAGIALRARALKQEHAGSLPNDDGELAYLSDFGRDVEGFLSAKAKALEGWILCSDDRWHHPDIARNVLHIWIGRLESRRIGAWGNVSRAKDGGLYGLDSILEDLDEALAALAVLDPQDVVLRKAAEQQGKWWDRHDQVTAGSYWQEQGKTSAEPIRLPNRMPIRTPPGGSPKVSEAKRSLEKSSSLQSRDDSPKHDPTHDEEIGIEEGSAKRTPPSSSRRERAPPWPAGWFERLKADYPKREAWGRAEKAAERIRKAGLMPFEVVLAGVERLAARVASGDLALKYTPLMATWLNDRGWEDESSQPAAASPPPRPGPPGRPMAGADSAAYGFASSFRHRSPPRGPIIDHDAEERT